MTTMTGSQGADTLTGTGYNDELLGLEGDDILIGTNGNDILNGGGGNNTLDYGSLGRAVTILPRGSIDKGDLGIDKVSNFSKIIGATGQANTIDARTADSGASLNVNLANNSLGVNIPNVGSQQFEVVNFVNVVGSDNNDTIIGDAQDNIITGSKGNDTLDGGRGNDTLDYSNLGRAVTILPRGVIDKGDFGKDTVNHFTKIIGATGQANSINANTPEGAGGSLNVNLANNSLGINLPNGVTQQFEVQNFVNVTGSTGNDTIIGDSQNNIITGSKGNDTLDGGTGNDTLDYSNLGRAVTILPRGVIDKGDFGKDTVNHFTKIVGATGQANSINANTPEGAGGSLNVNLANNSLGINLPNGVTQQFEVQNFVNVTGSTGNDTIIGDSKNNIITGSKGNDTINGGGGYDTVDYSNLGQAVSILPKGSISKGSLGTDTVNNVTKIIGATGQANTIDARTADAGASLNVDLSRNSLNVNIPGAASLRFDVQNFVNVIGSKNNDTIVGGNVNSTLTGGGGNDTIRGGNQNDIITGTDGTARGCREVDTLTGGGGKNKFVLGDKNGAYYVGNGKNDYAVITDFNLFSDSIDIGSLKNYSFGFEGKNTIDLFSGCNPWNRDLVAKIQLTDTSLSSTCKGFGFSQSQLFGGLLSSLPIFGGFNSGVDAVSSKMSIIHC